MPIVLSNYILDQQVLGSGLISPLTTDESTGDFQRVSGPDNVRQCIIDLLGVRVGERVMREDDGSPFPPLVFENAAGLVNVLPMLSVEAILRYEPRVTNVTAKAVIANPTTVSVSISWVLRATGTPDSLVYPFYLEPVGGFQ